MTNRHKCSANTDSPSKEPLMSPARGIGLGKRVPPKGEQPTASPIHACVNVSYKHITPGSTPENSPQHLVVKKSTAGRDLDDGTANEEEITEEENAAEKLLEDSHTIKQPKKSSSASSLKDKIKASGTRKSISLSSLFKSKKASNGSINKPCSPIETLSTKDLHQKLDKIAWQSIFVNNKSSSSNGSGGGSGGGGHERRNGGLTGTSSDTVLSTCTSTKLNKGKTRQTRSVSSLQPLVLENSTSSVTTGTVKRTNGWSGEQMRADMVDFSERYAHPNTVISLGILAVTVGCVSLVISASSPGMRLWSLVGCVALAIGGVCIAVGSCWYYTKSRLVYVSEPDVEIKVVSGTEGTLTSTTMHDSNCNVTFEGSKITGV